MNQEFFHPTIHITLLDLVQPLGKKPTQSRRLKDLMRLFLVGSHGLRLPLLYRSARKVSSHDRDVHYRMWHSQPFMPWEVQKAPETPPDEKSQLWGLMADVATEMYPGNFVTMDLAVHIGDVRAYVDRASGPNWLDRAIEAAYVQADSASSKAEASKPSYRRTMKRDFGVEMASGWLNQQFAAKIDWNRRKAAALRACRKENGINLSESAFNQAWDALVPTHWKEPGGSRKSA